MLGDNIRLLRSVRGISQVELGEKLNVSIIVDGLSTEELSHIRVIIDDLVAAKRRMGIEQNDDRPRE